MATTKKPTGLTITRNGYTFICEWKIADNDYADGQWFQWRTNLDVDTKNNPIWYPKKDADAKIGAAVTAKTVGLSAANYYPTKSGKQVTAFYFRVCGKRSGYTQSAYKEKGIKLYVPNVPSLDASWDSEHENRTTFTWNTEVADDDARPFQRVEAQTILVKDCDTTKGAEAGKWKSTTLGWASANRTRNDSIIRTEDSSLLAGKSYTRWFRVRSVGLAGASAWRYAKHVYAKPYAAKIIKATASKAKVGTNVTMSWKISQPASHPIDGVDVQYLMATPAANRNPVTGSSWTTALSIADTSGTDAASFTIDDVVGLDECLWVRVKSNHDVDPGNSNYSSPFLVASGNLAAPDSLNVSVDSNTYRATISAANNSSVPDSKLAVVFKRVTVKKKTMAYVCGIITDSSVTVQCPRWSNTDTIQFGVYAFQGTAASSQRADGNTQYAVTANMKSSTVWQGGTVPMAPANVSVSTPKTGEVLLSWEWSWDEADRTEISWSKNENVWDSVNSPSTYVIENTHAASIRIPDLETGVMWYFRVRLGKVTDNEIVYGPYSDTISVDLTTAPLKPFLQLSSGVASYNQKITFSWSYESTDNSSYATAQVRLATIDNGEVIPGNVVFSVASNRGMLSRTSTPRKLKLNYGDRALFIAKVWSSAGLDSEWSDPVSLAVAEPATCVIESTSLLHNFEVHENVVNGISTVLSERDWYSLTQMPLILSVSGAGEGGTTTVIIERTEAYQMDRPDESVFNGYEGETVFQLVQNGTENPDYIVVSNPSGNPFSLGYYELDPNDNYVLTSDTTVTSDKTYYRLSTKFTVEKDMLIGLLDDGAKYRIIATVEDGLGQTDTETLGFIVDWAHQAIMPEATVSIDETELTALITPVAPTGAGEDDTCDIYRLSADKPELIVTNGEFGTTYVDPYPATGPLSGHRVVYKTVEGDYITADKHLAWIDLGPDEGDYLKLIDVIIDFDGDRVALRYNTDLSNQWSKDFKETVYLGGSIQGDWNPGVSRSGSASGIAVATKDIDLIRSMRRLAAYSGICHIRTPEGSSFSADVQVSESRTFGNDPGLVNFDLSFTRVDSEQLDGRTLEED